MSAPLLAALLAAEHEAVYGYGVVGGRLDEATRRTALAAFDSHRARRDQLAGLLVASGQTLEAPPGGYDVATATRDQALALAVRLEEGLSVRWRDLIGGTGELPALGLLGLTVADDQALYARELIDAYNAASPVAGDEPESFPDVLVC